MQPVSQSFIKELYEYIAKRSCGIQFEARYVHGVEFPSSDAMALGQWFEFMCTGQKTKFGHTPIAKRNKPKKLTKKEIESGMKQEEVVGELSKKYSDALVHVEAFKSMIKANEFEIVGTGVKLKDETLGITGDIDLIVRKKGEKQVRFIDMKFSGLLDNKWDDLGWADESLEYKDKLMIQAVHYKTLGIATYGYEPDFNFWVFSSVNTTDRKNIKVVVDEDRIEEHKIIIRNARMEFTKQANAGWIARPNPKRCGSCILNSKCPYYVELPQEQVVNY